MIKDVRFSVVESPAVMRAAEHFGISTDNYISSCPMAGIVGFDLGRAGLVIVGRDKYNDKYEVPPSNLFMSAYAEKQTAPHASVEPSKTREYPIPEEVLDYANRRNVPPIAVIRVGVTLLSYAVFLHAGPSVDLNVHRMKRDGSAGRLDSKLGFRISPINTVIVSRKRAGLLRKPS